MFTRLDVLFLTLMGLLAETPNLGFSNLIGQYYVLFFIAQPLVYILLNDYHTNKSYTQTKYLLLSTIFLLTFLFFEKVLIPFNAYTCSGYVFLFIFYVYLEGMNHKIAKVFYTLFCYYNVNDFHEFHGIKFYKEKLKEKMESFQNQIKDHNKTNQKVYFKKLKGKTRVWKTLKFIVRNEKENRINNLKDLRREKINDYLNIVKTQRQEMLSQMNYMNKLDKKESIGFHLTETINMDKSMTLNDNVLKDMSKEKADNETIVLVDKGKKSKKGFDYSISKFKSSEIYKGRKLNKWHRVRRQFRLPRNMFNRILHIILFPFVLLFKFTLPDLKKDQTLRKMYFSFCLLVAYIFSFSFCIYVISSILMNYWGYPDIISGFVSSMSSLSLVSYCYFSKIISEYHLNTYLIEVICIDFGLICFIKGIFNAFVTKTVEWNPLFFILIFTAIQGSNLIMLFLNLIFKNYIPSKVHFFLFLGLGGLSLPFLVIDN